MFDDFTVGLIRSAPELSGLDLTSLPKDLTAAYTSIVAARMRLRDEASAVGIVNIPAEVEEIVGRMARLASTLEVLIAVSPERDDRVAAAFVAGAAHHVVLQAQRLAVPQAPASRLRTDNVSPEVSATLLFLIAESPADAAEMAKAILLDDSQSSTERFLLNAIQQLAVGNLRAMRQESATPPHILNSSVPTERAAQALYSMLLSGVRILASRLLGEETDDPVLRFQAAKDLCSTRLHGAGLGGRAFDLYPGPSHLASLLIAVSRDLPQTALSSLSPPNSIDGGQWRGLLARIVDERPYLWRNHKEAIDRGYLEVGTSSVVSFPTGAGKSTLSELKIAAALARGGKVVFLAPTLALVDQTAQALKKTFPAAELARERADDIIFSVVEEELPAISVMTPERCLAHLSFNASSFVGVGLLVFDECHLLHPMNNDGSRRALDAMLCLLNFIAASPAAELLLLSAMIGNAVAVAAWLENLTGRTCLALDLKWKPTRQVRGCVVYGAAEIAERKEILRQGRRESQAASVPIALKRQMTARPYGFFCLNQTWHSREREDYSLVPLLDTQVPLSTSQGDRWYLTPNGNEVAAQLAVAAAGTVGGKTSLKTLIFTQTIPFVGSTLSKVQARLQPPNGCILTPVERNLYNSSIREMGGPEFLYVSVGDGNALSSSSAPHHGLLLSYERQLHESLFKRADGLSVLVATSTLAQGMNLPSQVVIIAGDSRFDPEANQMERLEAHELLNAAGRAGRAGKSSYGFVLVVPSKVMPFDDATATIHGHWTELQAIFSQSDQCLEIEDPIEAVLDRVHAQVVASETDLYFLRRLPVPTTGDVDAPARTLLGRSFAAYLHRQSGDLHWADTRINAVLARRREVLSNLEQPDWADQLAASAGVEISIVRRLRDRLTLSRPGPNATILEWTSWVFQWLQSNPGLVFALVREQSLQGLFGSELGRIADVSDRAALVLPKLESLLNAWMSGQPLADIEQIFGTRIDRLRKCENARQFVLRIVPELAYIFALPSQVLRLGSGDNVLAASLTGTCVREGFNSIEQLALSRVEGPGHSRVEIHEKWREIRGLVPPVGDEEPWNALLTRIRNATRGVR